MELNYVTDRNSGVYDKFFFDIDTTVYPIGLDTETSGLDPFTSTLYLLQISIGDCIYLFDVQQLGKENITELIRYLVDSKKLVIAHNAKFDIKMLMTATGIVITNVHDTMWTETLINLGIGDTLHKLSTLVAKYTGNVLNKEERKNFYENYKGITQELLVYSADDVRYLKDIYDEQMKQVVEKNIMRVYELESQLVPVVAQMEYNGVLVDKENWTRIANENLVKLNEARISLQDLLLNSLDYTKFDSALAAFDALVIKEPAKTKKARLALSLITGQDEIKTLVRKEFNFGSNAQMLNLLQTLGVDLPNTNEKTLKELRGKYVFIDRILEFREFEKKESTYGINFLNHIHPITGRIHTEFLNLGARTGRFSSGDSSNGKGKPNLQNILRESEYRSCFIARPGYKLLSVDYSQQEYRLVGAVSHEPVIIKAYQNGMDMHTSTAMIATGKPKEQITKEDRNFGKTLNFAIIYGSSEYGLAHNLKISIEKGKEILDNFYAGYPQLSAFKKAAEKAILKRGYSITPMGRKRYFETEPSFSDSRELFKYRARIIREGFNMIIQGGGADITKLALVRLYYENPFGDNFRLLMQVHDEIVAEVKEEYLNQIQPWMENIMLEAEQQFLGDIPAAVEGKADFCWSH